MNVKRNAAPVSLTIAATLAAATGAVLSQETVPSIDDIHWPYIESYCTFLKEGRQFIFDDLDSWRFVAFTNFPPEAETDPLDRIFMRLDGSLRELNMEKRTPGEGGMETRLYRSSGTPGYEVSMELTAGEKGYESTPYSGTITVRHDSRETSVSFGGDCGV